MQAGFEPLGYTKAQTRSLAYVYTTPKGNEVPSRTPMTDKELRDWDQFMESQPEEFFDDSDAELYSTLGGVPVGGNFYTQ
jgi:hypothetical protein